MDFVQLFNFAHVSKQMRRIVRDNIKVRNHTWDLYMTNKLVFRFKEKDRTSSLIYVLDAALTPPNVCFLQRTGQSNVAHFENDYDDPNKPKLKTYWMNVIEGLSELYKGFAEIFRMPLNKFILNVDETGVNYEEYISWFNTLTARISKIQFIGKNCDYQKYWYSISGINIGSSDQSLESSERQLSILNFDRVYIRYGQSIKVNQILSMRARIITIHNVEFSARDHDTLLRGLNNGLMPNLVKLDFGSTNSTLRANTLLSLNAEQIKAFTYEIPMKNRKCVLQLCKELENPVTFWNCLKMEKIAEDQN